MSDIQRLTLNTTYIYIYTTVFTTVFTVFTYESVYTVFTEFTYKGVFTYEGSIYLFEYCLT